MPTRRIFKSAPFSNADRAPLVGLVAWTAAFAWWSIDPARPTLGILLVLLLGSPRLLDAWRGASGTALRPTVSWLLGGWTTTALAQMVAIAEPVATGRPGTGHLTYLASLGALAAAVSILNARRPGEGAWALLTALLVLVFLIPWLEGIGLARGPSPRTRLRLEAPWSIFYALLAATAVINHLPTRHGLAALALGLGWLVVFRGLRGATPSRMADAWGLWGLAVAAALAIRPPRRSRPAPPAPSPERLWRWFTDRWGLVWALRVQERFNRTAEALAWPIRLTRRGVVPAAHEADIPPAALPTLVSLLSRFASRERLEAEAVGGSPCGDGDARRSWS